MNRQGVSQAVVYMIIALVTCVVILAVFFYFKSDAQSDFYDKACQTGCGIREIFEFAGVYLMDEFCVPRPAEIWPDDWTKCNATFKENNDPKGCMADQIAELARRCWVKRGSGEIDCGDLDCYDIQIHDLRDTTSNIDVSMDYNYFNDFLKVNYPPVRTQVYSDYFKKKVYYDSNILPGECWTIKYVEDNDFAIWGIVLQLKDVIILEYEMDCKVETV